MSETNNTIISFTIGVCVGSACAWFYASNKYKQIAQEEIDSVKDVFAKKTNRPQEIDEDEPVKIVSQYDDISIEKSGDETTCTKIIERQNYANYSKKEGGAIMNKPKRPYVLSPEEYDDSEYDHYDKISMTYYSDLILVDENNELVGNIEEWTEALSTFGQYEDDSVFVRNDTLECDFEILLDQRKYSESLPKKMIKPDEVREWL